MTTLILSWSAGICCHTKKGETLSFFTYRLHKLDVFLLRLNHGLEVNVDLNAKSLVISLTLTALLFYVVHPSSAVLTIDLQFFDLVQTRGLLRKCGGWLTVLASCLSGAYHIGISIGLVATVGLNSCTKMLMSKYLASSNLPVVRSESGLPQPFGVG